MEKLKLNQEATALLHDIKNDIKINAKTKDKKADIKTAITRLGNMNEIHDKSDYRDTAYQDRYQDTAYRDTTTYNDNAGYRDGTTGL